MQIIRAVIWFNLQAMVELKEKIVMKVKMIILLEFIEV